MTTPGDVQLTKFVTTFDSGGTERQFVNLALGLDGAGFTVRFGCLKQSGRLLEEIEARGMPVDEYRMRSFYSLTFAKQQAALARELRRQKTDILHAYNLYGNVFAIPAARLAGVPLVVAGIRDCGVYLTDWTRRVQRHVCRLADLVIVNAQGIRDWLVDDGYDESRIVVIRNGIDLSRFLAPPASDPAAIRREFGIPPGAPLVAVAARLCPSKGFDVLIEAMPTIRARWPDVRLLVVGEQLVSEDGELRPSNAYATALAARARDLGVGDHVIFTGFRSDVPVIHRAVDVMVQPSLTEGLSNSVLECMASGAALVTTPVGGTPEVVTQNVTGVLVPPGDPRALGEAIAALLGEPARRAALGQAARAFVREAFSIPRMVTLTREAYLDALTRQQRSRRVFLGARVRLRPGRAVVRS